MGKRASTKSHFLCIRSHERHLLIYLKVTADKYLGTIAFSGHNTMQGSSKTSKTRDPWVPSMREKDRKTETGEEKNWERDEFSEWKTPW